MKKTPYLPTYLLSRRYTNDKYENVSEKNPNKRDLAEISPGQATTPQSESSCIAVC